MLRRALTPLRVTALLFALQLAGCVMVLGEGFSAGKAKPAAARPGDLHALPDNAQRKTRHLEIEAFTIGGRQLSKDPDILRIDRTRPCRLLAW